jgi:carboxyl-terminal processing protease
LIVLAPIPGTPAFRAGIRIGDEIADINGQPTKGLDRLEAVKLMRGPGGTQIKLVIRRGEKSIPMELTRETIPIASLHGDWRNPDGSWNYVLKEYPRIGYLRLLQFGEKSTEEMCEALTAIEGKVDGLILDLRNNSGGLLETAVDICDLFLDERQIIVSTRGRDNRTVDEHFSTSSTKFDPRLPMAILVDRNSASASEIVAACLQDYGRAVVIGEQTWGKGTVQNIIPIEHGQSAIRLTTASYWRPGGQNIDRHDPNAVESGIWGVQPNAGFAIELTEETVFDNMRDRNRRDLEGLNDGQAASDEPESSNQEVGQAQTPYVDAPLERAIEYLKSQANIGAH